MKKTKIILLIVALVIGFGVLVYFGVRHSRGMPFVVEEKEVPILKVSLLKADIDLTKGISKEVWKSTPATELELMHQVMILPWGSSLVSPIRVRAFHNNQDVFFHITWNDTTENRNIAMTTFSDACAILFPIDDESQPATLMMGFLGKANIWQWKASQDKEYWLQEGPKTEAYVDFYYPFEEEELFPISKTVPVSAANDLMAIRIGTITPKDKQTVEGRGFWDKGSWYVVLKRSFVSVDPELDATFNRGKKRLCAFAVWEGETGDRGGRKSISDWVELEIE